MLLKYAENSEIKLTKWQNQERQVLQNITQILLSEEFGLGFAAGATTCIAVISLSGNIVPEPPLLTCPK